MGMPVAACKGSGPGVARGSKRKWIDVVPDTETDQTEDESSDGGEIVCFDKHKKREGKRRGFRMGGSCHNVTPKDDNPYAWWSYGLEVMETGTSMVLDGIRAQRKCVGLMQKAHEERGENSEEDKTDEEIEALFK